MTNESQVSECDVLIVGGGLVGSSLAIALDGSGLRVALIEAQAPQPAAPASDAVRRDARNLALARATVNALKALDVWPGIAAHAVPIRQVHISRRGEFGVARLKSDAHGLDAFGAVMPAHELGKGLLSRLDRCESLLRLAPATLSAVETDTDHVLATVNAGGSTLRLRTRLLIGADGTTSFVRDCLGIGTDIADYAQTAFVATVLPARAMEGCAYERFTATGPVALLPLADRRAGVVLTVPTAHAVDVAALDDAGFIALLHDRFGYRLGRFSRLGRRVSYPLRRVMAQRLTGSRAVLIGNAAQTIHPIGAQGFNLGLRDALTLADLLIDQVRSQGDPGSEILLQRYVERRGEDREGTAATSDALARWTASETLPLKLLRSAGLLALDRIAPLQDALVRRGMGFRGHVPTLALGGMQ